MLNGVKHPAQANSLICKRQTLHSVQGDKFNKNYVMGNLFQDPSGLVTCKWGAETSSA